MNMDRKKHNFRVKYVGYGIANRYPGRYIELHRKLQNEEFRFLHQEILEHEKSHDEGPYTAHDLNLDMQGFRNRGKYWKFLLTTPSAWLQFSPIMKAKGEWHYDITLILFWMCMILMLMTFFGYLFIWS